MVRDGRVKHNTNKNPFAQAVSYWQVLFMIPAAAVATAEESFSDIAISVANFETDEQNHIWSFELIFSDKPDAEELKRRLFLIASLHNIDTPEIKIEKLEQTDWLSQVAQDFPPLSIGRFFVHGAHVSETPKMNKIAIQIDAGAAFGSGEHATTSCCLAAMEYLARKHTYTNILDMGTGSGILAIAAAKLWKSAILAVDLDPVSVRVTKENAAINKTDKYIKTAISDGYISGEVKNNSPYDLIIANILARPLVSFAPYLKKNLAMGGVAILSGLLASQEKYVLAAHRTHGLRLKKRFIRDGWSTLVIG
ncbi:MAG: 50S ribosomal protein L11 methyltransferase [Rickettsiales bacterium]